MSEGPPQDRLAAALTAAYSTNTQVRAEQTLAADPTIAADMELGRRVKPLLEVAARIRDTRKAGYKVSVAQLRSLDDALRAALATPPESGE